MRIRPPSSRPVAHASLRACGLVALVWAAGFGVPGARASDGRLGEPWEAGIEKGVERQNRERTKRQPETILRQAKLLAARPADGSTRIVRLYLLARAYGIAGDHGSARATYQDVLRLAPRCYFAFHDLAMLDLESNPPDRKRAEQELRRAIGLNPGYLTAQRKLTILLLQSGRGGDALIFLERIVDAEPADLQARYLLARTLLGEGLLDRAEREVALLVRRDPRNPAFQTLKAQVYLRRGRYADARKVYRALAVADPGSVGPLQGFLRCLDLEREKTKEGDVEGDLWVLEGLYRLEHEPARKAKLKEAIDGMRTHAAGKAPAQPEGPPDDGVIAARLPGFPPEKRVEVLRYVWGRPQAPSKDLLETVIRMLSPRSEPSPQARMWALRVLGRFGGFGLEGLVRHSLGDPAPEVRPVAADVMIDLAKTAPAASAAALLALGVHAADDDVVLASAARAAIVDLTGAGLAPPEPDTEAGRRAAFLAWWTGPAAREAKIAALVRVGELQDPRAEELIVPYVLDPDSFVMTAAWRALAKDAPRLVR
ncbi:MAG: tetratricopeptide repeat protein, partial [Planctomycetota bacterium]